MSRQYAIIGLGRLGASMVQTLTDLGHEVLGMDCVEELVQDLSGECPKAHLVTANATDESALRDLNVEQFDGAAVMIGEDMEASILVTANLKEIGVPMIVSRAATRLHARVLEKVGADRVVEPERELGVQLARIMASPSVIDYVDLGEDEALIETEVPEAWVDKSLEDLQLARKHGVAVVTLKCEGEAGTVPHGDTVLRKGDVLIIGGSKEDLDKLDLSHS